MQRSDIELVISEQPQEDNRSPSVSLTRQQLEDLFGKCSVSKDANSHPLSEFYEALQKRVRAESAPPLASSPIYGGLFDPNSPRARAASTLAAPRDKTTSPVPIIGKKTFK